MTNIFSDELFFSESKYVHLFDNDDMARTVWTDGSSLLCHATVYVFQPISSSYIV